MAELFVIIFKNGVPMRNVVLAGDVDTGIVRLEQEKLRTDGMTYQSFPSERDPQYQALVLSLPRDLPDIQDQLNAIWRGGVEMEEMRARILQVIGPVAPIASKLNIGEENV